MTLVPINWFLATGGVLSAMASALHLAIIVGGAPWYRFFGAGEAMAAMAEAGHWYPTVLTIGIAIVLATWSLYAFSGAGFVRALPLLRPALIAIAGVYLLRGLVLVPVLLRSGGDVPPFWWWSSIICLGFGLVHLIGLVQIWSRP